MGSMFGTAIVFFVSLVIFHVVMLILKEQKKTWKFLDYAWLSVLGLGLITTTVTTRHFLVARKLPIAEHRYRVDVESALRIADDMVIHYGKPEWDPSKSPEVGPGLQRLKDYQVVKNWFSRARQKIDGYPPNKEWRDVMVDLSELRDTKNTILVQESENFWFWLNQIVETEREYENLLVESEHSTLEGIVAVLSPWLIAIALSGRITKVTATLMDYA